MIRVGLTGNVASGKSSVAELFREWGATLIDADVLAREALAPGSPGLAAVVARFGKDLLLPGGALDRAALRHRVMASEADRLALNAIVHPIVNERSAELERAAREAGAAIVVHDIPLLFEVLDPAAFDAVVLVDAPPALRRQRLMETRALGGAEADALIAAQMPSVAKRARATMVIDNDGSRDALARRAREVWAGLQALGGSA